MKQCFGYVRVSTVKQGEGVSLEAQKEAIQIFAERNEITICQWFEEKVTAAKKGRPLFNSMVRQLKQGKAQGLVVHKIDRSARNFADWAKIGDLADMGIDIHFATESLDFRSRGGRLTADIQAVIAADYVRNLREETIKGINGRLKQGLFPWNAPIGYLNNGGGKPKTPDPISAPLVKKMFHLYASGSHSIRSLRAEMERLGLRNVRGGPVSKCGVETMLNNPFYCGLIRIKITGRVYEGIHEPLVTAQVFERVQDTKAGRYKKKITKHNHTYRGLFRCQYCNSAMTPEKQKGHVYYRCQTTGCKTKTVREDFLESVVGQLLAQTSIASEDIEFLMKEIENWFEARRKDNSQENSIELQLHQLKDRMERLTDALIDGIIDQDTFNIRHQGLLLEQTKLKNIQSEIAEKRSDQWHVQKFLERMKNVVDTYEISNPEEKRQFVEIATSNRSVAGRNIHLKPSEWLQTAENCVGAFGGGPHRTTSRRRRHMQDQHMEKLIKFSQLKDVKEAQNELGLETKTANKQGHTWKKNFRRN